MVAGSSQQSVHTAHAGIRVDHSWAQPLSSDLTDVDTEGDRRNQPAHSHTAGNSQREVWDPGTLVLDLALLCYITGPGALAAIPSPIVSGPREMHQGPLTP